VISPASVAFAASASLRVDLPPRGVRVGPAFVAFAASASLRDAPQRRTDQGLRHPWPSRPRLDCGSPASVNLPSRSRAFVAFAPSGSLRAERAPPRPRRLVHPWPSQPRLHCGLAVADDEPDWGLHPWPSRPRLHCSVPIIRDLAPVFTGVRILRASAPLQRRRGARRNVSAALAPRVSLQRLGPVRHTIPAAAYVVVASPSCRSKLRRGVPEVCPDACGSAPAVVDGASRIDALTR